LRAPQMFQKILSTQGRRVKALGVRPNKSLKWRLWRHGENRSLTEGAVDDFAARQYVENDMINRYVRAMNYMELTVRRRSHVSPDGVKRHLAPVR